MDRVRWRLEIDSLEIGCTIKEENLRKASKVLSPDPIPGLSPNASSSSLCFSNPFIGAEETTLYRSV